jgi:6-phosphogluconolactonase
MRSFSRTVFSVWMLLAATVPLGAAEVLMYVGTYTRGDSKGIYAYRLEDSTGKLTPLGLAGEAANPSFVTIHPNRRFLYAVGEGNEAGKGGTVTAFSIDAGTGKLTKINTQYTRGGGPCYVRLDKTGKCALVANYGGGSVISFPVNADGSLGESASYIEHKGSSLDPKRQAKPYGHSINPSPDNRFAVAADLGTDQLFIYRLDPTRATLTPNEPAFARVAPGSGPRHFAFHPSSRFAYAINEMRSTVTVFRYDASNGVLTEMQTVSTLPADFKGNNSTAEVQVHPSGRFLYGSNRGHDSIAVFSIDPRKGMLTLIENVSTQGRVPRNFGIDPSGRWLIAANQNTNNLVVFRIDEKTGRLTATGQAEQVGSPVCVKFVPPK